MSAPRDPAVLLATLRAAGSLAVDDSTLAEMEAMRGRVNDTGRLLVRCAPPSTGSTRGRSRGVAFGWSPHATPSPEDNNDYPVRRLAPTSRLTWACCLGLAWPERTTTPYPGAAFTRSLVIDAAAELGLSATFVKASLDHDLIPAHLVTASGATLRLGPAAAGMPPAFVDSIRRFHEQLPRLDIPVPVSSDSSADDELEVSSTDVPPPPSEEDWEW